MIRTLQLIFFPFATWERIVAGRRSAWTLLGLSVLPLMAAGALAEGYALVAWGKRAGAFGRVIRFSPDQAQAYELVQVSLTLAIIFLAALFVMAVGKSLNFEVSFNACLMTCTYGFGGIFVSWFIDAIPGLNSWMSWGLGVALSIAILYHGVALVLKPPQTKGFGLFLMTLVVFCLLSGMGHALALGLLKVYF